MGQYYTGYLEQKGEEPFIFNLKVDGEYTLSKLMEHSWWKNDAVNAFCNLIYHNPGKVSWVGDYADTETRLVDKGIITQNRLETIYQRAMHSDNTKGLSKVSFCLDNKFLVNHTRKEYMDLNRYWEKCEQKGWCIHPVPLLTALGNGLGGGDFYIHSRIGYDDVGIWADQELSIEDDIPKEYREVLYQFMEK